MQNDGNTGSAPKHADGSFVYYIAPAEESCITQIMEIEQESISPPWTHGALLGEMYRDDSFFAVARSAAGTTPAAGFVILRKTSEDEGELLQIAVSRVERRRGIANALLLAALAYAEKNAVKTVFLEVRKSNVPAVSLYKKYGLSTVRTRKDYYSDPTEDALVMRIQDLQEK